VREKIIPSSPNSARSTCLIIPTTMCFVRPAIIGDFLCKRQEGIRDTNTCLPFESHTNVSAQGTGYGVHTGEGSCCFTLDVRQDERLDIYIAFYMSCYSFI